MLEAKELIVISDIHMGPERERGLFRAGNELARCLNWIFDSKDDCYIVLAGDIFDYLVLSESEEPADFYNFDNIGLRTKNIINKHPEVFNALAKLAASPKHQLLFIAGNHDPEVIFPEVQSMIETRLVSSSFKPITRWIVHGETLRIEVGAANILIEHGNAFDKFNRVDHTGLREILSLTNRGLSVNSKDYYTPPFGSSLVLTHIIPIRRMFPWVDYLEPGTEAVYVLMRELTSVRQKASFLRSLKNFLWTSGNDEFTKFKSRWNPEIAYRESKDVEFINWLNTELEKLDEAAARGWIFKDDDADLIKELVSEKGGAFDLRAPDSTYDAVSFILKHKTNLVITGHTHQAKIYPVENGLYINTGTWGQILEMPDKDATDERWSEFLNNLRAGAEWKDESFLRPTFASVSFDSAAKVTTAALSQWRDTQPEILSQWSRTENSNLWKETK